MEEHRVWYGPVPFLLISVLFRSILCRAVLSASVSCMKDKTKHACQKEAALSILLLLYPGQKGLLTHRWWMSVRAPGVNLPSYLCAQHIKKTLMLTYQKRLSLLWFDCPVLTVESDMSFVIWWQTVSNMDSATRGHDKVTRAESDYSWPAGVVLVGLLDVLDQLYCNYSLDMKLYLTKLRKIVQISWLLNKWVPLQKQLSTLSFCFEWPQTNLVWPYWGVWFTQNMVDLKFESQPDIFTHCFACSNV